MTFISQQGGCLLSPAISAEAVTILAVFHTSRDLAQELRERMSVS